MGPLEGSISTQLKDSCLSYSSLLLNVGGACDSNCWNVHDNWIFPDKNEHFGFALVHLYKRKGP